MSGDEPVNEGNFVCSRCDARFPDERKLMAHWGSQHREYKYPGATVLQEGVVLEDMEKTVNDAGYVVDVKKPIDIYNNLRRILVANGIRDKRESIIELFSFEEPNDWRALERILTRADIVKSKRDIIVDLWKKSYEMETGDEIDDEDDEVGYMSTSERTGKRRNKSPMAVQPEDMMGWGMGDYMKWAQDAQKWAMNAKMQAQIMEQIMGSMGFGGGGVGGSGGKLPAEVQAKLLRLEQLEEESRFQKQMEPLVKELRYLRAEQEDKKNKSPLDELKQMAIEMKMLEQLGAKDASEAMKMQMEERVERMRLETQKEIENSRLKAEQLRDANNQMQMKAVQTEMGAKLDMMKQAYELASQSKKEDLLSTIQKAKEITDTFKNITGESKTSEDRKMEAIAGIIDSATKTLQPVAMEIARSLGGPKPGGVGPGPMRAGPSGPPRGVMPPLAKGQRAIAKCTNPGCGIDIPIDNPNQDYVDCPNCRTKYRIDPQAPSPMPPTPISPEALEQKRSQLLDLPREELDEAARTFGIAPEQFPSKEELVEGLLRNRFGVA